jgi:hypothetical protein
MCTGERRGKPDLPVQGGSLSARSFVILLSDVLVASKHFRRLGLLLLLGRISLWCGSYVARLGLRSFDRRLRHCPSPLKRDYTLRCGGSQLCALPNAPDAKPLAATERIGHVKDFYFDDHDWVVRYLLVDTGPYLLVDTGPCCWAAARGFRLFPSNIHNG